MGYPLKPASQSLCFMKRRVVKCSGWISKAASDNHVVLHMHVCSGEKDKMPIAQSPVSPSSTHLLFDSNLLASASSDCGVVHGRRQAVCLPESGTLRKPNYGKSRQNTCSAQIELESFQAHKRHDTRAAANAGVLRTQKTMTLKSITRSRNST